MQPTKVVGAKQVKRALNSHEIEAVFIANDAENKVTDEDKGNLRCQTH